jgi:gas vesicle protein
MERNNKILIAAGVGLAIGGILGLLFAPAKGTETRNKIKDAGTKLKEGITGKGLKVKERINTLKEGLKERMEETNEKVDEYI